ncbi:D-aspartate oxidase [Galendromus occidentalis]|uniref:D-aspartate oxidase n=1 Tax=Galendromus occidentalis TaxID=34638 RepID=A0AAJ6VUQ7_9ACAR|nr:D-aspartate oxidase [Galendromus occidentalis]
MFPQDDKSAVRVAIVGGGISGMSTALCAIEDGVLNASQTTIIAEKVYSEITSYIAAGLFRPDEDVAPDLDTAERWYRDTFERWSDLEKLNIPHITGVKKLPGYSLSSFSAEATSNRVCDRIFPDIRSMTADELKKFPRQYKYGVYHTTFVADPQKYLPYLEDQLRQRGVRFLQYRVDDLADLAERFDIVVNCSGLGAKHLAKDNRVVPIRGQVVKVRNKPEVTHFYYADDYYILPGVDWVTLGGTRNFANSDLRVSKCDRENILRGCQQILPLLKANEEIADMVGLRPYRSPVRVEAVKFPNSDSWLVHNYGHGGQGVNLSWGTAREATRLIRACLKNPLKSRL